MICCRCAGLMVIEPTYVMTELDGSGLSPHQRCLNCGNVEDPVICLHRPDTRSSRVTGRDRLSSGTDLERGRGLAHGT
jgi:hypothetical protein